MKPLDISKRDFLKHQSHEQLETFILNDNIVEKSLRDRLYLLSGCHNFGENDGTDGVCYDCSINNKELFERCCLFQTAAHMYCVNKRG